MYLEHLTTRRINVDKNQIREELAFHAIGCFVSNNLPCDLIGVRVKII